MVRCLNIWKKNKGKMDIIKIPYSDKQDAVIKESEKEIKKQCEMFQDGLINMAELYYKIGEQLKLRKQNEIPPDETGYFLFDSNNWDEFSELTNF